MDKPIKHSYCVIPDKVYAGEHAGEREVPQWGLPLLERASLALFVHALFAGNRSNLQ